MTDINSTILETITINDFKDICRLCPSKTRLTQIYSNQELLNLLQCTQLQFDENDGLPKNICQNCITKLNDTFNFIKGCKLVDEAYRKCLNEGTNLQIKVETIFIESNIKQEFHEEEETVQEVDDYCDNEITNYQNDPNQDTLNDFVTLGKEFGCNSLIMRYFTEREGPEKLSMHVFITSFMNTRYPQTSDEFLKYCELVMTDELCAAASDETLSTKKNSELNLELRYGRITSSKMHSISCSENPNEGFIETIIGFYKIIETKTAKTNELHVQKIEKQLNIKIRRRGLVLNKNYPEFVAKLDGVTDDAVIKLKYPKNYKDYYKYVDKDKNLSPKTKTEMHLLMFMTNLKTSFLCVVDPNFANTSTIVKVDFNERYFAGILRKNQEFWRIQIFPSLLGTGR